MTKRAISRRSLLEAGACVLAATAVPSKPAGARAAAGLSPPSAQTIRKYYAAWETKSWRPLDILLADDFTFTSPNNDDHISKAAFKTKCWDSQVNFIDRFDLQRIIGDGNEAFVLYVCHVRNGKTFRNAEYLRVKDRKVEAIECFFGAPSSFASAVGSGK